MTFLFISGDITEIDGLAPTLTLQRVSIKLYPSKESNAIEAQENWNLQLFASIQDLTTLLLEIAEASLESIKS